MKKSPPLLIIFLQAVLNAEPIQEVLISADSPSALSIGKQMTSTTVISREEIEAKKYKNVAEAISEVPGLNVITTGFGQTVSVFIRGQKSEQTLVLVDGIEFNDPTDPGRGADLSHLSIENIERIEVVRGAQSVLYPGIGSTIEIFTRTGGPAKSTIGLEGGAFKTARGNLHTSGLTASGFDYALGAGLFRTDGISSAAGGEESDGARTATVSGKFGKRLTDRSRVSAVFRYYDGKSDLDLVPADTRDYRISQQNFLGRLEFKSKTDDWEPTVGINLKLLDRTVLDFGSSPKTQFTASGEIAKFDWINRFPLGGPHQMVLGVEGERQHARIDSDMGSGLQHSDRTVHQGDLFAQYELQKEHGLYGTVGMRIDYHSAFHSVLNVRGAPGFRIPETGTNLRLSAGSGFKAPSIYQLYGEFGNSNLHPERAFLFDVGVEQTLFDERVGIIATVFYNKLQDLVDFDIPNNRFINVGRATTQGIEMSLEGRVTENVKLGCEYTFLETRDEATGFALLRRPRHRLSSTLSFSRGNWDIVAMHVLVGPREDVDASSFVRKVMPGYHLVNLVLGYRPISGTDTYVRIDNLLNAQYQAIDGYGTMGIAVYLGVKQEL